MVKQNKNGLEYRKQRKMWMGVSIVFFVSALCLQIGARNIPFFAEWYSKQIYPLIVKSVGRVSSLFSFSVGEMAIYVCVILSLCGFIKYRTRLYDYALRILCIICGVGLVYTLNCGINYYRIPFSSSISLQQGNQSKQELINLCSKLAKEVNQRSHYERSLNRRIVQQEGKKAMEKLGGNYPQLSGFYPVAKPVGFSRGLSIFQISGIYSPFSVEANYNKDMVFYNIPFTICHELSHLKGFMREDEANFIAYLACIQADSDAYQYSGYLMGWIYATNALYKVDSNLYQEIYTQLNESVKEDLNENSVFWNQYEGKASDVSVVWNDTYLKWNDQQNGVQSYGKVVDLMLAYEKKIQDESH